MLVDILASLFAGLGMFFIGVKLIGAHLKQMTGRRFRMLVMKGTAHPAAAALLGSLAGAITQSTNAVAFIMMNLATAGLI
jgi:phosphate:Na+ symporter